MARDSSSTDEVSNVVGVGPPGSLSRRRLLQSAAAAGLTLSATQLPASSAAAAVSDAGAAHSAQ